MAVVPRLLHDYSACASGEEKKLQTKKKNPTLKEFYSRRSLNSAQAETVLDLMHSCEASSTTVSYL